MMRAGSKKRLGKVAAHLCSGNDGAGPPPDFWFSAGYDDARKRFIEAVAELGNAEHFSLPLEPAETHAGRFTADRDAYAFEGDDRLTIDIAVIKGDGAAADSGPMTLHLSGVHGLEAFAGCAIQLRFLSDLAAGQTVVPEGTTTILVHCVNPHGFKYSRRYNENNVDLNRNFVMPAAWSEFDDAGTPVLDAAGRRKPLTFEWLRSSHPTIGAYKEHSATMFKAAGPWDSRAGPDGDAARALHAFEAAVAGKGFAAKGGIKEAMISGQYFDRLGTFYGGERLEASHAALFHFLEQRCGGYDPVVAIDVHSGLGPPGVDTIMQIAAPGTEESVREIVVSALGNPEDAGYILSNASDENNAAAGYELMKGNVAGYLPAMKHAAAAAAAHGAGAGAGGWTRGVYFAQEFGTVPPSALLVSGRQDNAAFVHGGTSEELANARRANEAAFYVRTPEWRADIIRRGTNVLRGMQVALHQRHAELPVTAPDMNLI